MTAHNMTAAELEKLLAERDAALAGAVKVRPLKFDWAKDDSRPNPSCWRCEGDGFFAYVLIPYDPGNVPATGTGKWNANPNHRGRMGFETREAAMAYCEEAIRQQAAAEVKHAIDKLSLWAEASIQPDTALASKVIAAEKLAEAAKALKERCVSGEFYSDYDGDWKLVGDVSSALAAWEAAQ